MKKAGGRLVALDGVNGSALDAAARALGQEHRDERSCVSVWDASAIFNEVLLATVAGLGYGVAYYLTGRIQDAVAVHFAVNAVHQLFLSAPAVW